ncbi:hypothetical protein [Bellilinea sp.]|uniref:hypothetical protein n=1 Tax=Bellilinea sp. TaxID=2838785 RepID=UPI002ADDB977|nr:hypothetical protein [Bellilinea sp.]
MASGRETGNLPPGEFGRRNPFPALPEFAPALPENLGVTWRTSLNGFLAQAGQNRNCGLYGFRFSVHIPLVEGRLFILPAVTALPDLHRRVLRGRSALLVMCYPLRAGHSCGICTRTRRCAEW